MSERMKGKPSWKLWVVVAGLFIFAVVSFATFGPDALDSSIDLPITHTACDIYDDGSGTVTIYDATGNIWTGVPFELGEKAQ